jgi:hypothetical protein
MAEEKFLRKLSRDAFVAFVVGIVLEPTMKALHFDDFVPYLPSVWFVIVWFIALDYFARSPTSRRWAEKTYPRSSIGRKLMSFLLVALIGAGASMILWATITGIFSLRSHAETSQPGATHTETATPVVSRTSELAPEIWRIYIGSPHQHEKDTSIILVVRVTNIGSVQTVALDYSLTVTMLGKDPLTALPTYIHPDKPIMLGTETASSIRYSAEDALYNKTATKPITPGGGETGILVFTLRDIDRNAVNAKGTVLTLSCVGFEGQNHKFYGKYTMGDNPHESEDPGGVYYPGMEPAATSTSVPSVASRQSYDPTPIPIPILSHAEQQTYGSRHNKDLPYGLSVIISTTAPINPINIAVVCDGPIGEADVEFTAPPGAAVFTSQVFGKVTRFSDDRKAFIFHMDNPPLVPRGPLEVKLFSTHQIRVMNVKQLD